MDYYLNEYSLSEQFESVEKFYDSLHKNTIPVLRKIKEENATIWKKDTFWQLRICPGITILNIPEKKNERTAQLITMKTLLSRVLRSDPYFDSSAEPAFERVEYQFDEEKRDTFEKQNCFLQALESEGKIISFEHDNYKCDTLSMVCYQDGEENNFELDNIFNITWWEKDVSEHQQNWRINDKYTAQVRSREFEYHPPHFHVLSKDGDAIFQIKDGSLYKHRVEKRMDQMTEDVQAWYPEHKQELIDTWNCLQKGKVSWK